MNPIDAPKDFDCIAYKRRVQAEIYEDIKGMTSREQIEYFRMRAEEGPLGKWWKAIERRHNGDSISKSQGA